MIQLVGKLRRKTPMQINKKDGSGKRDVVKLSVEHEISRDEGQADLILESLFLDPDKASKLTENEIVCLDVRPYPSGKNVAYAVIDVVTRSPKTA